MKTLNVNIFGNEYKIKTDEEGNLILTVAKIVDQKMREVHERYPKLSRLETADYACLNLVEDYLRQDKEKTEWVKAQIGLLIEKLEKVLY
ncbi:MAG: cell division protein ZapA [candidate division WOR-3 bacterium]